MGGQIQNGSSKERQASSPNKQKKRVRKLKVKNKYKQKRLKSESVRSPEKKLKNCGTKEISFYEYHNSA